MRPAAAPAVSPVPRSVYVGPRPFAPDEHTLFFGRQWEAQELRSLVVAQKVVLVYGPSGAGKTSLLNTGFGAKPASQEFHVLPSPRLRDDVGRDVAAKGVRNVFVYNTLAAWTQDRGESRPGDLSLAGFLQQLPELGARQPFRLLLFDQFEDIFTAHPTRWADRQGFLQELAKALEEDDSLRAVLAMREEYVCRLEPYAHLLPGDLRVRFPLDRLDEAAALEAIQEPAEAGGCPFQPDAAKALAQRLRTTRAKGLDGRLVSVPGEFIEPVLLQVVCHRIWEARDPGARHISLELVEREGNTGQALVAFCEEALREAARATGIAGYENRLRSWCEANLITPLGTRAAVLQGPDTTAGILNSAVAELERRHLLRGDQRGGNRLLELTHDMLIEPLHQTVRQSPPAMGGGVLSVEDVRQWVDGQARILRRYRRLRACQQESIDQLIERLPDDPKECERDRINALALFATQVLEGALDLGTRIQRDSYPLLEDVWLADLKEFKAYLIWEGGSGAWDQQPENFYYQACAHIRGLLLRPTSKSAREEFQEARAYLEEKYLDPETGRQQLIRNKAHRIWQVRRRDNPAADWAEAEAFVELFYDHIVSAVMDEDPESVLAVLKAFENTSRVVRPANCWEAALAVYFLNRDIVAQLWSGDDTETGGDGVCEREPVAGWPTRFQTPGECAGRFWHDPVRGDIVFRGVMTQLQKQALHAALQKSKYREAVERLFRKTRRLVQSCVM